MKINEIKNKRDLLKYVKTIKEVKEVSTTNGWGFAGYYGKRYTIKDGLYLIVCKWSRRHLPSYDYTHLLEVLNDGGAIKTFEIKDIIKILKEKENG